ncbi:phosphomannomutase/phosphoglucomutase [bacterium]|nr:phosphomannomutase/phosphoglucomutase [bacterium]NUN45995.1 phosphomannomutase/phosphoglucomutase [bacterium]
MPTKKKPVKKVVRKSKLKAKKATKKTLAKTSARPAKKTKSVKPKRKPSKKVTARKKVKPVSRKVVKKKSTGKKSSVASLKPKSPVFVNPNIFREYDIRGIVADDLQIEVVELLGKAYGTYMVDKGAKVVTVGRDVRTTSLALKNALVKGMMSTGLEVIDVGEVPTPVLYYSIVFYKTDGGIMVTGSHNPREYNGFKMCLGLAPIFGTEIQRLRHIIDGKAFATGNGTYHEKTIISQYIQMITEKIHLDKKFKIVIDAGNGTAGTIAPKIFRKLGCEVIELYCEPDGTFPNHLPDPTKLEYIKDLQDLVVEHQADLGLGFDGDTDRVGAIDELGRVVWADKLIALLAREINQKNPGQKILFDVKCSQGLIEDIQTHGGVPVMWKTGHSLLKAKMKELHNPLAGEMSGHIFFADDFYGYDDAIYVAARLVQMISRAPHTLSELSDSFPKFYSTPEIRVDTTEADKFRIVDEVRDYFRKKYEIIDVDGVRILYGDGWGLVRASNTQPVLVVRFEAKTEARVHAIMNEVITKLREYPTVQINEADLIIA